VLGDVVRRVETLGTHLLVVGHSLQLALGLGIARDDAVQKNRVGRSCCRRGDRRLSDRKSQGKEKDERITHA
jgi:hypothetical protein